MRDIFFYAFNLILQWPLIFGGRNLTINLDSIDVGIKKNYILNETIIYIIEIQKLYSDIEKAPPRIYVSCKECNDNHPVLVVVTQKKGVLSWELPAVIDWNNHHYIYKNLERTLCPYDISNFIGYDVGETDRTHPVTLALSTSSHLNKKVELVVNIEEDFVLQLDGNKMVQVSPSTPSFYLFEFPSANVTSVLLEINSDDDICLVVSVQNVSCPVFDQEENIAYRGYFQTVTKQGGLTLTKKAFPNGFYVVLVVTGEEKYCSTKLVHSLHDRNKNVVITTAKNISPEDYILPVCLTVFVILLFCAIMFATFIYSVIKVQIPSLHNESQSIVQTFVQGSDRFSDSVGDQPPEREVGLATNAGRKKILCVLDLSQKDRILLKKRSLAYFRNVIIVAIFYFLPVIQLVFSDQYHVNQFGVEDLCYYNFLCAHPLGLFSDFNHIFSNIGYIAFGILFIILTVLKERKYTSYICKSTMYENYGIPQQFGLFYAMGVALIVEGIMSSCYHICPNYYNFQFDTSFMYVICTLCMIKIYQTRHPDVSPTAYATFSLLATVIFVGLYGVYSSSLTFWIFFTIVHLSTCMYISLKIYFVEPWKLTGGSISRWFNNCVCYRQLKPRFPSRFFLLVLVNICNWALASLSFVFKMETFSSYLLAIFMLNLILYTIFYIIMKIICKEKLPKQSVIFIILSMISWSTALYFFFNKTMAWKLTPAESKIFNRKCILLDFYDYHDIWHFLSAAALFFSFMVLLTFDDDLINVHRAKIMAF